MDAWAGLDPIAIWTDGRFGRTGTKTASGLILVGERWRVACVIDRASAGLDAGTVLGVEPLGVPVVADLAAARAAGARSVVIGVNSMDADDVVPPRAKAFALEAVAHGFNMIGGAHAHLGDDPDLVRAANAAGVRLVDVRVEGPRKTWTAGLTVDATVLLTVGTDSAVGKMTTALLVHRAALARGIRSAFLATGQIAAMCGADAVVSVDHTLGDFIIGAVQHTVHDLSAAGHELVIVEGQGAIMHHACAGGVINLVVGAAPDAVIMCHDTDRESRALFPGLPMGTVAQELEIIEDFGRRFAIPARLAGFSVFGSKPFTDGDGYDVPVVNTREPGAADALLDSLLRTTGHAARRARVQAGDPPV